MPHYLTMPACLLLLGASLVAGAAQAFDHERYTTLARSGLGDISALIKNRPVDHQRLHATLDAMLALGVEGCRSFLGHPAAHRTLLELVLAESATMTRLSKSEISEQWYRGDLPKEHGIDIVELDHFGDISINYMDSIVHPAAAQILLREYQATGSLFSLKAARHELKEAIEHVDRLKPATGNRGKTNSLD
ncbi:MAG: hypothetical protein AB1810_04620 [Pseudomonadota bacterium]